MKRAFALAGLLLFCLAGTAAAATGGIRFNYTRIFIENLPIGNTISMKKVARLPMRITNKFDQPMLIVFKVEKPAKVVEGFESIPETGWVTTEYQSLTAPAFAEMECDVMVSLPDDPKLLGKKFHANISATLMHLTGGGLQVGYAATGNFLFSVAPIRNEAALKDAMAHPSDAAFEVMPPRADMWNVAPNQRLKVVSEINTPLELTNQSDQTQTYLLTAIDPKTATVKMDEGSHPGNIDQVVMKEDEIKLKPGKHARLDIEIQVPGEAEYKQSDLAYLIQVASGMKMGAKRYIVIYLHAGNKPLQMK